jgi:hypothetical protein
VYGSVGFDLIFDLIFVLFGIFVATEATGATGATGVIGCIEFAFAFSHNSAIILSADVLYDPHSVII